MSDRLTGSQLDRWFVFLDGWDDHLELRHDCGFVIKPLGDMPLGKFVAITQLHSCELQEVRVTGP